MPWLALRLSPSTRMIFSAPTAVNVINKVAKNITDLNMEPTPNFIIQAADLTKQVNSPAGVLTILDNIRLEVKYGESVAITGVSGSGKSTLIGILAGLDLPTSGSVTLDNVELTGLDETGRARLRNRKVGFVFQSFQLLPGLTALENVMLPLELAGNSDAGELAQEQLAEVGLAARTAHYPNQLSGGEQQRVAIARAFVGRPAVLFADEMTGNLDRKTAAHIIELLFHLNSERGATLVLVTHDEAVATHCSRKLTLDGGRIIRSDVSA